MRHVNTSRAEFTTPNMRSRASWLLWAALLSVGVSNVCGKGTRVWRDDTGAYRDLVVAIHPAFIPSNCSSFFYNLKASLESFSKLLWRATHGRVHLGDVGVIVPPTLSRACSVTPAARATWQRWATADFRMIPGSVTSEWEWGAEGSVGVGVAQPEGCGRPGHHITLDPDVVLELTESEVDTLGRSLVGAWAKYRWGVFEERGYEGDLKYPPAHMMDDVPKPTTCTTVPTEGQWISKRGTGPCSEDDLDGCVWVPDLGGHVNTSILYRADMPNMWGFCDSETHDYDSPTPQNLLCGSKSVWEVMNQHADFATRATPSPSPVVPTEPQTTRRPEGDEKRNGTTKKAEGELELTTPGTTASVATEGPTSAETSAPTTEGLFLDDVRKRFEEKRKVGLEDVSQQEGNNTQKRTKRESNENVGRNLRPSLVTAHIATSTSSPDSASVAAGQDLPVQDYLIGSHEVDIQEDSRRPNHPNHNLFREKDRRKSQIRREWSPPPPDLILLSPAPEAVVLALDLSKHAVAQVNMDELRGGILRWLWGLGQDIKVGVLAAYNNASYPLTLGPLLHAPTTAAKLEDELALLPSLDEVEDGVYGGEYCLDCVIKEASKMLENGGVAEGAGVLLLAACSPEVSDEVLADIRHSPLSVQTLALCPSADLKFDQLAGSGESWVLTGPSLSLQEAPGEGREQRAAAVLTAATQAAIAIPGDPTLVRVGGLVTKVEERMVVSAGPYATMSGRLRLAPTNGPHLVVITTQHQAKIIELTNPKGEEIDLTRDTNQRFWAIISKDGGEFTYTIKFLQSSIEFPFSVTADVYERKQENTGVVVKLHTNVDDHEPLYPGSRPLVVWAEVTLDGRPVVGAKVVLRVSHLDEFGPTDATLDLLDNGNAEPDVRAHDGVYTRYVTILPGEGRYALTATVTDHQGAASVLAPRRRDGRVVPVSAGQFTVSSAAVSVTVARVTSADIIPPSRITDLTVTSVHDTTVNLTWAAPGGDLDQGSAWRYELKMYTERGALSEERFNTSTIAVYCITHDLRAPTQTPANYGTPQHCLTELPFTNLRWYFAIRAIDSANNTGRISNIVSAFVPDPPTTPPPTPTASETPSNAQTVIMSTISSANPNNNQTERNTTLPGHASNAGYDWRVWVAVGVGVCMILLAAGIILACICCCKRNPENGEKDPDRPIYKIYVNNAYIQEEDGEIKVVSNGKLVDDKEPSQVQEWVNSLSKFGSTDVYGAENGETTATTTEAPLVECRPRASMKYASPVRFGVLTNGSIMREACASSSSTSSSKPSDDPASEDFKYRDLSETTSNSTTDGGASASSTATAELPPPPPPLLDNSSTLTVKANTSGLPPPPPPSQLQQPPPPPSQSQIQPLGLPGPTVISIHAGSGLHNGYSSDEEGGFRPRTIPGPGPRRYLPNHFSSFRYLPPPPEYRSGGAGGNGPLDYPTCHTISRGTATLPHGTVRSVKKRRHISFV